MPSATQERKHTGERVTYLYLIRHGEATKQLTKIIAGPRGDTGLTAQGICHMERLRDRLHATGEIPAEVLISSPLARARQSAEILAPVWGLPIRDDAEVEELRKGVADGLPARDAFARFGRPDFRRAPFRPFAPGGETWAAFVLRAATALDRITREHAGKHIVIVCHGGIIHASFQAFYHLYAFAPTGARFATANASITAWACEDTQEDTGEGALARPDTSPRRWRLLRYNDAAHCAIATFASASPASIAHAARVAISTSPHTSSPKEPSA